ncbi:hypothetical protein [Polyangium fumosum]|uniref:Lipocalin-like domain-containing protein n=1 Tax=Polyangium fumosum TaxID=889272 RepID=A0A4U1IWB8_9BACT|nr:hypothetical protein [Polyangium fumosum]TKC98844.1 hypothetical protein E8A74_40010 [Polyangium fumosum]
MRPSLVFSSAFLAATLALFGAPACGGDGGDTGNGGAGASGGTGGTGGAGGGGTCSAAGKWEITYEKDMAGCVPAGDLLTITPNASDVSISVTFEGDDTMPMHTCNPMPPEPASYTATGSVSADGCTLTAESDTSYCFSGEDQCEKRELTLQFAGDDAMGTLVYSKCGCPTPGSGPITVKATAKRVP